MKIDGQEISEQTLEHVRALQELLTSAAAVWAMVPGAEQNAINDLQSDQMSRASPSLQPWGERLASCGRG